MHCYNIRFSPASQTTLLCVGMQNGDVQLWDIVLSKILIHKPFILWNKEKLSESFKKLMEEESSIPLKKVLFCEDGSLCAAAYSKNLLHVYFVKDFQGSYTFHDGLEIEVYVGPVTDLVFSSYEGQTYMVLCGGCNLVALNVLTGATDYAFMTVVPIRSLCSHNEILYTCHINDTIKEWILCPDGVMTTCASSTSYYVPGVCNIMFLSADRMRWFSLGISKDAGLIAIINTEQSIRENWTSMTKVSDIHMDTFRRFLVIGAERVLQVRDFYPEIVDGDYGTEVLGWKSEALIDITKYSFSDETDRACGGDLSMFPVLRCNKQENLLAISCEKEGIYGVKILGTEEGYRLKFTEDFIAAEKALKSVNGKYFRWMCNHGLRETEALSMRKRKVGRLGISSESTYVPLGKRILVYKEDEEKEFEEKEKTNALNLILAYGEVEEDESDEE